MDDVKFAKKGHWVFTPYVRRNGRIVYPRRSRFFRFWVED